MPKVLVIEDELKLQHNLQTVLENEGYEVVTASSGEDGFCCATTQTIDAIILDLTLPGRDGLEVLSDLRERRKQTPVIILTARDAIEDRVAGLDRGADDYLVKPFAHAELLARVRSLLRRTHVSLTTRLQCGDAEIDLLARRIFRRGTEIELSQREFDVLEYLVRHKNTSVTRDMLARDVWKEPQGVITNVIDVCINALRKKVDIAGSTPLIRTIRGVGYSVTDQ